MNECGGGSRRKQHRPARISADNEMDNEGGRSSSARSVIVRSSDVIGEDIPRTAVFADESVQRTTSVVDPSVSLPAGTLLGPFQRFAAAHNDDNFRTAEGKDIAGRLRLCSLHERDSGAVKNIRIAKSARSANCDLFEADNNLFIRVTRAVEKLSDLRANFRANTATDVELTANDNPQSGEASCGCSPRGSVCPSDGALASTSSDLLVGSLTPNAIYLPVALHDNPTPTIQVVGYPQIVIPVVLNRAGMSMYSPPLLVDEGLSRGFSIPPTLTVGDAGCAVTLAKVAMLPRLRTTHSPDDEFDNKTKSKNGLVLRAGCKRQSSTSSEASPLDLSLHVNDKSRSLLTEHSADSEKRFRCECGVAFNSEVTLAGHKKYYCHNSATAHPEVAHEPQRKVPIRCHQCEFEATSASQLAQHVRSTHAAVHAYVCQVCGYKGYSQRGIRAHLRGHSECAGCAEADLLKTHVYVVKADAKSVQCARCGCAFPTRHLLKEHRCVATVRIPSADEKNHSSSP